MSLTLPITKLPNSVDTAPANSGLNVEMSPSRCTVMIPNGSVSRTGRDQPASDAQLAKICPKSSNSRMTMSALLGHHKSKSRSMNCLYSLETAAESRDDLVCTFSISSTLNPTDPNPCSRKKLKSSCGCASDSRVRTQMTPGR